ncbi:MAG: MFS transporter, partial [Dehalococcoidales bacterium]|nr:MFS transporter [Dehalococcoidales bacterium]
MITRFSLYGFLKNQRYFEPFIILFFLDKGLSFTQIGLLIGFRELAINLMEIPSGAIADLFGRRRSMMLSFGAYIISFAVFGFSQFYWHFFIGMFFFAIGEAFRTGTHKAMIFTWLRIQGRTDEKTRVYGYTRSWSKIGSAVSVILATVFVLWTNNYSYVFFFAIVPYVIGFLNFLTYPKELEGQPAEGADVRTVLRHLWECLRDSVRISQLRRLLVESMGFEGVYKAAEDYLQPVIKSLALMLPLFVGMGDARRTAILVGAVYFILYLASAYASRKSHRLSEFAGGEEKGSRILWRTVLVIYLALIPLLYFQYYYAAIAGFIALSLIQNFWRPMLISRFDAFATETQGATVLSIESQAKSVSTMIFAPIFGAAVDFVRTNSIGGDFWPVAVIAAA